MAKISMILKNKRRMKTVAKYATKRKALKAIIRNLKSSQAQVDDAYIRLQKMPKDASAIRVRNRCEMTGRPRGFVRKFGLSRISMRQLALGGELPGVTKSSW